MSSRKWTLQFVQGFDKFIRNAGPSEQKQFEIKIQDLEQSDNPRNLGEYKGTKKYGFCYVMNITKSYRLAYLVDEIQHTILLVSFGDHKELYGKDKKF